MSVVATLQKRGVGRRLIQSLEKELKPSKVFLSCSSLQHSAHILYEKTGFVLKEESRPVRSLLYRNAMTFLKMEKKYDNNNNNNNRSSPFKVYMYLLLLYIMYNSRASLENGRNTYRLAGAASGVGASVASTSAISIESASGSLLGLGSPQPPVSLL